ncbi:MAG TPA: riboflavin synthase [Candidatus Binatia bacterium]|nr:riboflavin synthase [Candidatus Binatia bacterium]
MFAGIITAQGRIHAIDRSGAEAVLTVHGGFDPGDLETGESIATNGVCLTVRALDAHGFIADLSEETLARTTLGRLAPGAVVNVERSLRVGDRVSGHFVFGHVDTAGRVAGMRDVGDGWRFTFDVPEDFSPYLVDKGSVAVDGISLTMCDCTERSFGVAVIPHTFASTNLRFRKVGDPVNLEADMLARYVRRVLSHEGSLPSPQ